MKIMPPAQPKYQSGVALNQFQRISLNLDSGGLTNEIKP
jgi:hypothetical protein